MKICNERFSNALEHIPQKTPPIWFMRQAGRYHSHYQNLKKNYTFEELCKNPDLAAETALGPINDFDFDVAILFSDILFVLEALGMSLKYDPGPIFGNIFGPRGALLGLFGCSWEPQEAPRSFQKPKMTSQRAPKGPQLTPKVRRNNLKMWQCFLSTSTGKNIR